MSLLPVLRDPFDTVLPLREVMNRLFEESFVGPRYSVFAGQAFPVDVYETTDKQHYMIEAALPGIKPEEIQVTVLENTITLHITKKQEEEKKEKGIYLRRERYEGEMTRTITLPYPIHVEKVEATFEHGMLIVQLPKSEVMKPKQIPLQVKEKMAVH